MTKEKVNYFKNIAVIFEHEDSEYIYIGPGDTINKLKFVLSVKSTDLYCHNPFSGYFSSCWSGDGPDMEYYLTKSKWEQLFGPFDKVNKKPVHKHEPYFLSVLKKEHPVKKGYVYVGKGGYDINGSGSTLSTALGIPCRDLYVIHQDGTFEGNMIGNCNHSHYYVPVAVWDSLFGKTEKAEKTMEEKIAHLKTFIGKRIKGKNWSHTMIPTQVLVFLSEAQLSFVKSSTLYDDAMRDINADGYVVALTNDAKDCYATYGNIENIIVDTGVEIVGKYGISYTSKDMGKHFEFGCARISKKRLEDAYKFMTETYDYDGDNRSIESIKIGHGTFTLKDIKTLLNK